MERTSGSRWRRDGPSWQLPTQRTCTRRCPALRLAIAALCLGAAAARAQTPAPSADPGGVVAELPPVVVTATGFEQRAFDTPASIGVVGAEALRASGPRVDLSEGLARVPGLTVSHRHNYAQDLQISSRGFGARATFGVRGVRLYTDGIPASMPDGQGQVSHFDLAGAERIEVLRGPFSALYGNSAGGVIQLVTAPVRERRAEVALDLASFDTHQGRVTFEAPLGASAERGWNARLASNHFATAGFRPRSDAQRTAANLRIGWSGERDELTIRYDHLDQPARDPLGLTRDAFDDDPDDTAEPARRFRTRKKAHQNQAGLRWRRDFPGAGALEESAVTAYYGHRAVTQWLAIPVAAQLRPTHAGGVVDFDRDYFGFDGRLAFGWKLGRRDAKLVAGAALEQANEDRRGFESFEGAPPDLRLGVRGRQRRDENGRMRTTDLYAQGEIELFPDWVATLGARGGAVGFRNDDRYVTAGNPDDSGSLHFAYGSPVAALQWRASPELHLHLSAGQGFESPTFGELTYRPDGAPGLNRDLEGQISRQIELGAKWRPAGRDLSLDAALFAARTHDEIGVATSFGGRASFQNVGNTTRYGAELAAAWAIHPKVFAGMALTWLDARYDDDPASAPAIESGNRIAGTSPWRTFAELAWRPTATPESELAAECLAQGRTAVDDRNSDFAEAWWTLALRARHAWRIGRSIRLEGVARLDNLLDHRYAGSVIVNEANGRWFEPAAPRSWYVGLAWQQSF
jgi:iron complex outermembrane receptor protein